VSSAHLTVSEFGTRCRVRRGGVERIRGSDRWNLSPNSKLSQTTVVLLRETDPFWDTVYIVAATTGYFESTALHLHPFPARSPAQIGALGNVNES
jgi:hypothetical protein